MAALTRNVGKLAVSSTAFLLCDVQNAFRTMIQYYPEIITVGKRMIAAANILEIPVIATEQYPKGLGNTVEELEVEKYAAAVHPKTVFSMCIPEVEQILKEKKIKSVVIFGIEAHVCVQQSCMDLLEKNYDVHVVADGCSSRSMTDRMFAFERIRQIGGFISTSESIMFQLMKASSHPKFREVQKLVMTSAPDSGLLSRI